jgi:queuine tRNA-ribosyltransferase
VNPGQGDIDYENFGVLHIKSLRYKFDKKPIEENCDCLACREISRSYLRYLLHIKSPTGIRYATIHNLHFFNKFIRDLRK